MATETGKLWAVDRLLLWTLGALAAVTLAYHPHPLRLVLVHGALALFVSTAAAVGPRSRAADALHAFAPLVIIIGMFQTLGFVIASVNPTRWDAYFAALDVRLFGSLVPAWRGALGRPAWLSDLLSVCYFSYYVVPTAMAVALYARRRRDDFDRFIFGLQVTLIASYLGYFLFPTSGPRVSLAAAQAQLGGGALSAGLRHFLHACELNALDAFPSGHTAVSLAFLAYGWRMLPGWRAALVPVVAGIVFSTVYLSHHYIVDLVAGAIVAAGSLAVTPLLQRALGHRESSWLAAKGPMPS